MGDMQTFITVFLGIAGGIGVIGGAATFIEHVAEKINQPQRDTQQQVEDHEKRLANDHKRLSELETSNRLIMRGVMQLMSHEVDGNHTAQLMETRDEMEQYLINR